MKKRIKLCIVLGMGLGSLCAQNIAELYKRLPKSVDPLVADTYRDELIEYKKTGQPDTVKNLLGGKAYIVKYDSVNNYLMLKHSANSSLELKLVKTSRPAVIAVIHTLYAPIPVSDISFFDCDWNPSPAVAFSLPPSEKWLKMDLADSLNLDINWVKKTLNKCMVSIAFDVSTDDLILCNHSHDYLSDEEFRLMGGCCRNSLKYRFDGSAWQLVSL